MCGIAGILRIHEAGSPAPPPEVAIPEAWLDVLDESIRHRGPDGQGRFRDRVVRGDGATVDVALVHRRLAVIDPAGGHQPMVSERGRPGRDEGLVAVAFNGCIYNHRELRQELQRAGHEFATDHSDTEALIHGWREWGQDMPRRLDGMFAFALWDRRQASLVMARDLAGEKPLYEGLSEDGRLCVFCSTVPAVIRGLRAAGFGRVMEMTDRVLHEWIRFGYGHRPPMTWVHEVEPGGVRLARGPEGREIVTIGRREPLPERDDRRRLSADDLDRLLERAVVERLEADVPLGCFLSGGVDSSLIAHYAKKAAGTLRTFTVAMPEPRYDESAYAEAAARHLGTDHVPLACEVRPAEDLVRLVEGLGLPFGDSSLLPAAWLSRAARSHVTVCLSGDGGDELFGGYERHVVGRALGRYRRVLAMFPSGLVRERDPKSRASKLSRLARAARHGGYADLRSIFAADDLRRLGVGVDVPVAPVDDPLRDDFLTYLPQDLLRKSDTASMAVALELRAPFLARSVVHAAMGAPLSVLMPRGQRKGLLRQVARKHLPAEIVDRPKMGFAIPISEWLRTDYGGLRTLLMDRLNSTEPFGPPSLGIDLDRAFIDRMVREHMERRRDHGQRLYMLLVLSIWADWMGRVMRGAA